MLVDEILEASRELAARAVEPLPGGLTNANYKVTSPAGAYVVRVAGEDTGLLAIDRENEDHNTIAAAEVGVGAGSSRTCPSTALSCSSSSRARR